MTRIDNQLISSIIDFHLPHSYQSDRFDCRSLIDQLLSTQVGKTLASVCLHSSRSSDNPTECIALIRNSAVLEAIRYSDRNDIEELHYIIIGLLQLFLQVWYHNYSYNYCMVK